MTIIKEFLSLNPSIQASLDQFITAKEQSDRALQPTSVGQQAIVLKGKHSGVKGTVTFIGLTKIDRQYGNTEKSILIEFNNTKVWTKLHNTQKAA